MIEPLEAQHRPDALLNPAVILLGSFTEPEYARVGLAEAKARETHDVVIAVMRFDQTARTIIDGRTGGFCKLIADRASRAILGCHVVQTVGKIATALGQQGVKISPKEIQLLSEVFLALVRIISGQ